MKEESIIVRRLDRSDIGLMYKLLAMFGDAFDEKDEYCSDQPGPDYLERRLEDDSFICIAAIHGKDVIGGLAAYVFRKFEQERNEIYIYDLAVSEHFRRNGVARAMIEKLVSIAAESNVHVVYIQAETANDAADSLYSQGYKTSQRQ